MSPSAQARGPTSQSSTRRAVPDPQRLPLRTGLAQRVQSALGSPRLVRRLRCRRAQNNGPDPAIWAHIYTRFGDAFVGRQGIPLRRQIVKGYLLVGPDLAMPAFLPPGAAPR